MGRLTWKADLQKKKGEANSLEKALVANSNRKVNVANRALRMK